jgi:virginiamycin B lyase
VPRPACHTPIFRYADLEPSLNQAQAYRANFDKNSELWASTANTGRVVLLDPKSSHTVQYLTPSDTNMRTVFIDNLTTPVTFWVGSNHDRSIVQVVPLD